MSDFLDQFARLDDERAAEVARRVEAGEAAAGVGAALGLDPVGVVAALARAALGPDDGAGPMLVQVAPGRPRLAEAVADEATLDTLFPRASLPARLALRAGLLQVLDAWDESHAAAQEADDLGEGATSAAWHMVAHRREPDPSNARYWARRVPAATLAPLGGLLAGLIPPPGADPALADRLLATVRPVYNPATMIDLCTRARPGSAEEAFARRAQRIELLGLLAASAAIAGRS